MRIGVDRAAAMPAVPSPTTTSDPTPSRVIPVRSDREEPTALLIEQHQHRVGVAQELVEPVDGCADEGVEVRTPAQPSDQLPQRCGSSSRTAQAMWRERLRVHTLDVEHPEDVRGAELEHVLHPVERRGLVDVLAQPVEDRPLAHGPFEHDRQPVLVVGRRIDEHHRRPRVLGEVAHRLGEELVRQHDVVVVDVAHA